VEVTIMKRRGTRGGNDTGILSLFLSFTLSFSSVMAAGAVALMTEAAEERDAVAVVAAVVAGHGAGWLAGWSRHLFFSPHRSRFSYTLYA
jgi:hypothetical protein